MAFFSSADHRQYLLGLQVDLANGMILGVTNVDEMRMLSVYMAKTLRVVELNLSKVAIN